MKRNEQGHHIFPLEAFRDRGKDLARIFGVDDVRSVIESTRPPRRLLRRDKKLARMHPNVYIAF